MRRRALLAVFVALLIVGAYGAYVVSYPKYPEVKGCVNPFAVTKPVSRTLENWSKAHIFFKLATSRDFWKLAKPWDVDYSHVKVAKHVIEYNGEKTTMLAMGIPLKDKKHVIALYEFSKPVQGVKVRSFLLEVQGDNIGNATIKTKAMTTNGAYTPTSSCSHECTSGDDCGYFASCNEYCCYYHFTSDCLADCCGLAGVACLVTCGGSPPCVAACVAVSCPICLALSSGCCGEIGSYCIDWGDMP
ncbi:hypothetical protein A3L11_08625 [Thermococcus siculi]|uniref:Uncharacterized protein n=1 Tax=Thermococcus siculi TaxID=72803 RepID=A0A2Z2MLP6_9EURY|nr:hypothetical protein [Thermococcus siculi]ASJ09289.1 hypothetical protein A3L11_08625 [Thermococcus siculi]